MIYSNGTTVALPACSQRVLVTEAAYNTRVKFLAGQTIGGAPAADLVSNTLLDKLDTGSALQIVSPTPLAGWVE